jgi:plastocyanin
MRRTALILAGLLCTAALVASDSGGEIRGQLSITRTLTKKRVVLPAYQVRGVTPQSRPAETAPINEWERVAVYIEGENAPRKEPFKVSIDQKGQRFDPDTVVVPVGSTVAFPNSDPIFHNVFSLSKAKQFDLGFYKAGDTRQVKFDQPGVVQVYCHLHSDMSAAILVVPNAWYKRPDSTGAFSFADIPAGAYRLVVWHKSAGFFYRQIKIVPGGVTNIAVEIPLEVEAP